MGYPIQQSSTGQNLLFMLVLSSDHITGATGLSPTVTLSKNGAAFGSPSGAVTEIANGWYKVAGNATDSDTLGPLALHATGTSCDPWDDLFTVVAYNPLDSVRLGVTSLPNAAAAASGGLPTIGATIPNATAGAAGGLFIAGTNAATTITTALTANITGNLSGSVGSVTAVSDKSGYSLATPPPTAATIATTIWQDTTASDFTTSGSIGQRLTTGIPNIAPGAADGLFKAGTNAATAITTALTANITGNLSGSVGVATAIGDKSGYSLAVPPPTAATIATTIWQDTTAGDFTTSGSIGQRLTTGIPNIAPGAAGGLFIAGTNAATTVTTAFTSTFTGNLTGNVGGNVVGTVASVVGNVDGSVGSVAAGVDIASWKGTTVPTPTVAGYPLVDASKWAGTTIVATSIPVGTTAGAAGGLFIAGTNAATTVTTAFTSTFTGNLTGNVGGNVAGSVASVTNGVTLAADQAVNTTKWAGTSITATSIPVATAAGASGGLLISGTNSGTTAFGALTVSGATTLTGAVSAPAGVSANITGNLSGSVGSVTTKTGYVLDSTGLDSIVIESGLNARQSLSMCSAALAGTVSGAPTGPVVIKGCNVATTRISAVVDADGNRTPTLTIPT